MGAPLRESRVLSTFNLLKISLKDPGTPDDGTKTVVMSSPVPASARSGDQFAVLYSPRRMKDSVVYTFDTYWSFPIYATVVGVVLTSLGLFARARRRIIFTESHANAA